MRRIGIGLSALLVVVPLLVVCAVAAEPAVSGGRDAATLIAQRGEEKSPQTAAITLSQLWDIQQKYFQQIKSFHFDMAVKYGTRPEGKEEEPAWERETRMSWTVEGENYRIDVEFLGTAGGKAQNMIHAFDGSTFRMLDGNTLRVEKTPDLNRVRFNAFLMSVPVFLRYWFAVPPAPEKGLPLGQVNLEVLKNPETWAAVAKRAQSIQPARMFDHDGVLVQFAERELAGAKLSLEVFFAKDLGYFPIYTKAVGKGGGGEMTRHDRVTDTKLIGGVIVPMRFESTRKDSQGKETVAIATVDPATAQVNQQIDPAVFTTLVPKEDIDSGKVTVLDLDAIMNRQK